MLWTDLGWKADRQRAHSFARGEKFFATAEISLENGRRIRTPLRALDRVLFHDWNAALSARGAKKAAKTSSYGARNSLRAPRIRQKIIGHARGTFALCFWRSRRGVAFRMFKKPPCHHCRSEFFDPLVQDRAGFLSEIGRMSEARQFVALQRIARSRQQEFPRGTGVVSGHVVPPK